MPQDVGSPFALFYRSVEQRQLYKPILTLWDGIYSTPTPDSYFHAQVTMFHKIHGTRASSLQLSNLHHTSSVDMTTP